MKKIFLIPILIFSVDAYAVVTEENLPSAPPPYGAYYIETAKTKFADSEVQRNAIAKHYGYPNHFAASLACRKASYICGDFVEHKRNSDPVAIEEMRKFGFKNWNEAVLQCRKSSQKGDITYCDADPFIKLRSK